MSTIPSWNTIRTRAKTFVREWQTAAGYEKGETHTFYRDFFDIFGTNPRRFASFEAPVKKLGNQRGYIDLFWPGMLLVEQKSKGRSLQKAKAQALEYFPGLKNEELPRYLLLCDFQQFELHDLDTGTELHFSLAELPQHVEAFAFIRGDVETTYATQEKVTIAAAERIGKLHDLLAADGFSGQDLQLLLIRIVFCLFADDTGIFPQRGSLLRLLQNRTAPSGDDLGAWLQRLFDTLNTPDKQRQKSLDEELAQFPYINGALFEQATRIPSFTAAMRTALIEACAFDWQHVSPAIFGSLFQSVMDAKQRREQGAHYTSEKHIQRLIGPLFLDALEAEFETIKNEKIQKKNKFKKYQTLFVKIGDLTFFDPACGCGNFLVVTYQKIRQLETRLLQEMQRCQPQSAIRLSKIDVDQFYGIELGEFAAKIAQIALWMTDHLCNLEFSDAFNTEYARIPLKKSPHIHCTDALELDWHTVLPAARCSYVLGNPPFLGKTYQSAKQSAQIKRIAAASGLKSGSGIMDYVCGWWIKAAHYVQAAPTATTPPHIAFVSTNSITQGEQVAQLWPLLLERHGMEISFAHRTFNWESEARGKAHVHVVIVGLAQRTHAPEQKKLFSYAHIQGEPEISKHKALSPYLIDASAQSNPHLVVRNEKYNLMGYPPMNQGVKPVEGGNYIFNDEKKIEFLAIEPSAEKFFCPFIGGEEFINRISRWILDLRHAQAHELRKMPHVLERIEKVKAMRLASKKLPTRKLAQTPTLFEDDVIPETPFLVLPEVSSETRDYIPIGYLQPPIIPSNKLKVIENAHLWHFAILTSSMHMVWMRLVAGRLESRYNYSVKVVYNPFPWPEGLQTHNEAQEQLNHLAQAVLNARAAHPSSTLADLYDRRTMPPVLRQAHIRLDKAVDRLYSKEPFKDDAARVALLLARYEALTGAMGV